MGSLSVGAIPLAAILFAWQFPHFNSLSWSLRPYSLSFSLSSFFQKKLLLIFKFDD